MPSLVHVLSQHRRVLLLDAASTRVQTGWWDTDQPVRWAGATAEAGVAVFETIAQLGVRPTDAQAYLFCEGPGSILGIRTVAMALRAWQVLAPKPVYAYSSLALLGTRAPDATIIADARRELWHSYRAGEGLRRRPASELSGRLVMPEEFRHWSPLPVGVERLPYSVDSLLANAGEVDLFHLVEAPDAFLHEEPSYVTWTPQIHRAPGALP